MPAAIDTLSTSQPTVFGQVEKLWQGFIQQSGEGEMRLPTFWAICEAWDAMGWVPVTNDGPNHQAVAQGDDRAAEFADLSLEDRNLMILMVI